MENHPKQPQRVLPVCELQSGFVMKRRKDTGADPGISERGDRKPNSGKRNQNSTFQCHFQSFSYKSLTNAPLKGGATARPAPPLNPRLRQSEKPKLSSTQVTSAV